MYPLARDERAEAEEQAHARGDARRADAGAQEVLGDREVADQAGGNRAAARLDAAGTVEQQDATAEFRQVERGRGACRAAADEGDPRPVIVGGTGLYLSALTEGLAEIPPIGATVRAEADARVRQGQIGAMLGELDARTAAQIDRLNPARIQRAR